MTLAENILLWLVVGVLAVIAATRGRGLLDEGVRIGVMEFILLLPRIGIGVVGAGFVAEALPNEWIAPWLGLESGLLGIVIATLGGALTPGRSTAVVDQPGVAGGGFRRRCGGRRSSDRR